jgi:hypothetical protein
MARTRQTAPGGDKPAEGFTPATSFGDDADAEVRGPAPEGDIAQDVDDPERGDLAPGEFDPRDAEIARLRAENAALKGVSGALAGGKFTVSWKDGPTLTIEAAVGESVSEALARHGVHSTPHKVEVHDAPADAKCGQHLPNGSVRSFTGPEK